MEIRLRESPMESIEKRPLLIAGGWIQAAVVVLIFGFFILGVLTYYTYSVSRARFYCGILASRSALEYRLLWRPKLRYGTRPNYTRLQDESI